MDTLYTRLHQFRRYINLSQDSISELFGCSNSMYRRYEKGITDIPISKLDKLVSQHNLNLNWLITGKGEMLLDTDISRPVTVVENEELLDENRNLKVMLWDQNQEISKLKKSITDLEELAARRQRRSDPDFDTG